MYKLDSLSHILLKNLNREREVHLQKSQFFYGVSDLLNDGKARSGQRVGFSVNELGTLPLLPLLNNLTISPIVFGRFWRKF